MNRIFLLGLMLCIGVVSFAQELTISDGHNDRSFDMSGHYWFKLNDEAKKGIGDGHIELFGSVTRISGDSITVGLTNYHSHNNWEKSVYWNDIHEFKTPSEFSFSVKDLEVMHFYKSQKAEKRRRRVGNFGAFLMVSGVGTLISMAVVPDKTSRGNLLISGVVQIGGGLILGVSSVPRQYKFNVENGWWLK